MDLDIPPGEVLALLGENGAGKSTLMKILYGFYRADAGEIAVDGKAALIDSPRAAMALGIGMVFQQFSLIPALTVAENLLLAHPGTPWWLGRKARGRDAVLGRLRTMAPGVDPARPVRDLAVGERQLVELVKVLNLDAKLVILDEPSSVLTPQETRRLWDQVRRLASAGHSVVFITHKFEDVEACADRVAVMRHGRLVETVPAAGKSARDLVQLMMGGGEFRQAGAVAPPPAAAPRVWVKGVSARLGFSAIRGVDLQLAPGEILGVAGVAGNGQFLLAETLCGRHPCDEGEVIVDGEPLTREGGFSPDTDAVAYIPEQPAVNGIAGELDLSVNLALKALRHLPFFPDRKALRESARELDRALRRAPSGSGSLRCRPLRRQHPEAGGGPGAGRQADLCGGLLSHHGTRSRRRPVRVRDPFPPRRRRRLRDLDFRGPRRPARLRPSHRRALPGTHRGPAAGGRGRPGTHRPAHDRPCGRRRQDPGARGGGGPAAPATAATAAKLPLPATAATAATGAEA